MLRGTEAHALADTGAADNFVSLRLVKHLDLEQYLRKKPYCGPHGLVEDADGLFSLSQLLSVRFGMTFFMNCEPHLLWMQRAMVLQTDGVDHLNMVELLTPPKPFNLGGPHTTQCGNQLCAISGGVFHTSTSGSCNTAG